MVQAADVAWIWCCCGCGGGQQLKLRSDPPGTSINHGCSPKKKKKKEKEKRTQATQLKNSLGLLTVIALVCTPDPLSTHYHFLRAGREAEASLLCQSPYPPAPNTPLGPTDARELHVRPEHVQD